MSDAQLSVRPHRDGWAVYEGAARLTQPFARHGNALAARTRLLKRRELEARPCLRCGDAFKSEGKHNRICRPCTGEIGMLG